MKRRFLEISLIITFILLFSQSVLACTKDLGDMCTVPTECCEGECIGNICCIPNNQAGCIAGADCCSGLCGAGGICEPPSCIPDGQPGCTAPADCCSGMCGAGNICEPPPCIPDGQPGCTAPADCCSGMCGAGNICEPSGGCRPDGDHCASGTECCSGLCGGDFKCESGGGSCQDHVTEPTCNVDPNCMWNMCDNLCVIDSPPPSCDQPCCCDSFHNMNDCNSVTNCQWDGAYCTYSSGGSICTSRADPAMCDMEPECFWDYCTSECVEGSIPSPPTQCPEQCCCDHFSNSDCDNIHGCIWDSGQNICRYDICDEKSGDSAVCENTNSCFYHNSQCFPSCAAAACCMGYSSDMCEADPECYWDGNCNFGVAPSPSPSPSPSPTPSPSPGATCYPNGSGCSVYTECCSYNCVAGYCQPVASPSPSPSPGACIYDHNYGCSVYTDCCSYNCDIPSGQCLPSGVYPSPSPSPSPGACIADYNYGCSVSSNCCSYNCDTQSGQCLPSGVYPSPSPSPSPGACIADYNYGCSVSSNCCSYNCNTQSGQCLPSGVYPDPSPSPSPGITCKPLHSSCAYDHECCFGNCMGGYCKYMCGDHICCENLVETDCVDYGDCEYDYGAEQCYFTGAPSPSPGDMCKPPHNSCVSDYECCTDHCIGGICLYMCGENICCENLNEQDCNDYGDCEYDYSAGNCYFTGIQHPPPSPSPGHCIGYQEYGCNNLPCCDNTCTCSDGYCCSSPHISPEPGCVHIGKPCSLNAQCCSLHCDGVRCREPLMSPSPGTSVLPTVIPSDIPNVSSTATSTVSPTEMCHPNGTPCRDFWDCCSFHCDVKRGICAPPPPKDKLPEVTPIATSCLPLGANCEAFWDCCSFACDAESKTCVETLSDTEPAEVVTQTPDGTTIPQVPSLPPGATFSPVDVTSRPANENNTSVSGRCAPVGARCALSLHCCSKMCHNGLCTSLNVSKCVSIGDECTANTECCSSLCKRNICVPPIGKCAPVGARCKVDAHCCSVSCVDFICALITTKSRSGLAEVEMCGDNQCSESENCLLCPVDCRCEKTEYCSLTGECKTTMCGNGECEPLEDETNCCLDCGCENENLVCIENSCEEKTKDIVVENPCDKLCSSMPQSEICLSICNKCPNCLDEKNKWECLSQCSEDEFGVGIDSLCKNSCAASANSHLCQHFCSRCPRCLFQEDTPECVVQCTKQRLQIFSMSCDQACKGNDITGCKGMCANDCTQCETPDCVSTCVQDNVNTYTAQCKDFCSTKNNVNCENTCLSFKRCFLDKGGILCITQQYEKDQIKEKLSDILKELSSSDLNQIFLISSDEDVEFGKKLISEVQEAIANKDLATAEEKISELEALVTKIKEKQIQTQLKNKIEAQKTKELDTEKEFEQYINILSKKVEEENKTEEEIKHMLEQTKKIKESIVIEIDAEVLEVKEENDTSNVSVMTLSLKNNNSEPLKNLHLIQEIPKEIAKSAKDIVFDSPVEIIEDDPVIAWNIDELAEDETAELKFSVKKEVQEETVNDIKSSVVKIDTEDPTEEIDIKVSDVFSEKQKLIEETKKETPAKEPIAEKTEKKETKNEKTISGKPKSSVVNYLPILLLFFIIITMGFVMGSRPKKNTTKKENKEALLKKKTNMPEDKKNPLKALEKPPEPINAIKRETSTSNQNNTAEETKRDSSFKPFNNNDTEETNKSNPAPQPISQNEPFNQVNNNQKNTFQQTPSHNRMNQQFNTNQNNTIQQQMQNQNTMNQQMNRNNQFNYNQTNRFQQPQQQMHNQNPMNQQINRNNHFNQYNNNQNNTTQQPQEQQGNNNYFVNRVMSSEEKNEEKKFERKNF